MNCQLIKNHQKFNCEIKSFQLLKRFQFKLRIEFFVDDFKKFFYIVENVIKINESNFTFIESYDIQKQFNHQRQMAEFITHYGNQYEKTNLCSIVDSCFPIKYEPKEETKFPTSFILIYKKKSILCFMEEFDFSNRKIVFVSNEQGKFSDIELRKIDV